MRYLTAAAVGAVMSAGVAHAAVVDLTYTVQAEVTAFFHQNAYEGMTSDPGYTGPIVGDIETQTFLVTVDTDFPSTFEAGFEVQKDTYSNFDAATGAISLDRFVGDEMWLLDLAADGTGSLQEFRLFNGDALNWVDLRFDVLAWDVAGLPEIAPVPLPASLPLLGVGLAAVGLVARRRRS